jgi:hypothetical protein
MPLRNRWTSECWLKCGGEVYFPSRSGEVRQSLREGLPIVTTAYECGKIRLDQTVYVNGTTLFQDVSVTNTGGAPEDCTLAFAIRPFNAEGACLLREIRFDGSDNSFVLDGTERFMLPGPPDSVHCSNLAGGDSAGFFATPAEMSAPSTGAACPAGLANGYAAYALTLAPGESRQLRAKMSLNGKETGERRRPQAEAAWKALLGSGTEITTPDERVNTILRASLATLLMLTDGDSVTPGPWTYHQFWFRDAAVMLRALDAFAFHARPARSYSLSPRGRSDPDTSVHRRGSGIRTGRHSGQHGSTPFSLMILRSSRISSLPSGRGPSGLHKNGVKNRTTIPAPFRDSCPRD